MTRVRLYVCVYGYVCRGTDDVWTSARGQRAYARGDDDDAFWFFAWRCGANEFVIYVRAILISRVGARRAYLFERKVRAWFVRISVSLVSPKRAETLKLCVVFTTIEIVVYVQ